MATMPPIHQPNPRKVLEWCWCPVETHHGIFYGTCGPKEWKYPLLMDPLRYSYGRLEGCDYTNSCGMDSTHSTWWKEKEGEGDLMLGTSLLLSCLQLSSTQLVAPVLGSSGFLGMYRPDQQSHPHPSSYHRPPTLLTEPNCFSFACWARLSQFFPSSSQYHLCSNITAGLAQMLPLFSLITVAGMARGIATQL